MKEFESKLNARLRDYLIPQLAKIFHKTCSLGDIECTISQPRGSFYLSDLFFLDIAFPGDEKRVLLKIMPKDPKKRSLQDYDSLFANEILFYKRLAISDGKYYPEYYLGLLIIIIGAGLTAHSLLSCPLAE